MAPRGTALDRKYHFEYDVGLWTFGTISVVKDRQTGKLMNCKTVPKSAVRNPDGVVSKLIALKEYTHENLCQVEDVIEDNHNFYILAESQPGNDVADWVLRVQEEGCWLQEQAVANYIRQTLIGIAHGHSLNLVHGDLRPSSLALTSKLPDAKVKVCDVGLAAILDPEFLTLTRTPGPYTAPELRQGSRRTQLSSADVWSVGAIAHALLVGQPPESDIGGGDRSWSGVADLLSGRNSHESWAERSPQSRDFVQRLLAKIDDRPTAARALQHPWLKGVVSIEAERMVPGDVQQKTVCYMMAVLLVPCLIEVHDMRKIYSAFQRTDQDMDGYVSRPFAEMILVEMGLNQGMSAALQVADVRSTGAFDYCSVVCAYLIAREYLSKVDRQSSDGDRNKDKKIATELVSTMASGFFQCFGGRPTQVDIRSVVSRGIQRHVAKEFEAQAGVDYDEVLECFPETRPLDGQDQLCECFAQSGGCGTPLRVDSDSDGDSEVLWTERLSIDGLQNLFGSVFSTCGVSSGGRVNGLARIEHHRIW
eukprot:TRINITY_DN36206_c0_g1_i1.p1 TRINITY_DN36206_c0_g1~~TRINITY_DN36206_c0_g1_i1.p1  ORF type:complete len:534 (-),score=97.01 TRINITY_DN36206_c0_g1_i1:86-1687(-)